jgi:hypothetical protein
MSTLASAARTRPLPRFVPPHIVLPHSPPRFALLCGPPTVAPHIEFLRRRVRQHLRRRRVLKSTGTHGRSHEGERERKREVVVSRGGVPDSRQARVTGGNDQRCASQTPPTPANSRFPTYNNSNPARMQRTGTIAHTRSAKFLRPIADKGIPRRTDS